VPFPERGHTPKKKMALKNRFQKQSPASTIIYYILVIAVASIIAYFQGAFK
jgi:hypothetical protein